MKRSITINVGNLCECGCGDLCRNRFVHGHNQRGVPLTDEHKNKIAAKNRTKTRTEEQKKTFI